jgi:hypothetical protein
MNRRNTNVYAPTAVSRLTIKRKVGYDCADNNVDDIAEARRHLKNMNMDQRD